MDEANRRRLHRGAERSRDSEKMRKRKKMHAGPELSERLGRLDAVLMLFRLR